MNDDEARKKILARRAAFVAAALATVACGKENTPQPCLSPPPLPPSDGGAPTEQPFENEVPPRPCLTPMPMPPIDAGEPAPRPCLSIKAPDPLPDAGAPPPRPCLKIAPKP